jgi:hypothetical protein
VSRDVDVDESDGGALFSHFFESFITVVTCDGSRDEGSDGVVGGSTTLNSSDEGVGISHFMVGLECPDGETGSDT